MDYIHKYNEITYLCTDDEDFPDHIVDGHNVFAIISNGDEYNTGDVISSDSEDGYDISIDENEAMKLFGPYYYTGKDNDFPVVKIYKV